MKVNFVLYDYYNDIELFSDNDFKNLYDYMMYNGIEYIINNIECEKGTINNKEYVIFEIEFKNNIHLFLECYEE